MYFVVLALVVALDQLTKYIVANSMSLYQTITVIPKLFDLCYIVNDGAAFGILAGQQIMLKICTVIMIIGVSYYVIHNRKKISLLEKLSLALIVGGGIGNMIDRVLNNCVVDFLDIHIIPIFNVADIGVTIGCLLLVITVMKSE